MAVTQLIGSATPGRRYGSFSGRVESILTPSKTYTATPRKRTYSAQTRERVYEATPRKRTYSA